ncbi:MAG: glycosyltransferase [Bacteroidota bacterium]
MEWTTPTFLQLVILGLTALSTAYFLFFILFAKIRSKEISRILHPKNHRIRVLIPARAEHTHIEESAIRAMQQSYDSKDFDVVVIADGLPGTTLLELKSTKASILQLDMEEKTDGHALREALKYLNPKESDITVIVDPDHVLAFDFLEKVNNAYSKGARVLQGHRTPKQKTSLRNLLIAANEEINHSIFRQGPKRLGLCPSLLGTGMAFDTQLLHACCPLIDGNKPIAQQLDAQLQLRGVRPSYLPGAMVFMERTRLRDLFKFSLSPVKALDRIALTIDTTLKAGLSNLLIKSLIPSKLFLMVVNLLAMVYFQQPYFIISIGLLGFVLLAGIPGTAYKNQLLALDAGLPRFLHLMFKYTGGETIARKNILFKNLPVDINHEDRHRSTASL